MTTTDIPDEWMEFFNRVKAGRPATFYARCYEMLSSQDIYEPGDLADVEDWAMLQASLSKSNATPGQVSFLQQALDMMKAEAMNKQAQDKAAGLPSMLSSQAAAPPPVASNATAASAPARAPVAQASASSNATCSASAPAACSAPARSEIGEAGICEGDIVPPNLGSPAACLILPGNEDPSALMKRGGIDVTWKTASGGSVKITKFRETPMPHVVDQDIALPILYLHFLDKEFFLKQNEYNLNLRAGNDNSEIQLVLPMNMVPSHRDIPDDLRESLEIVMRFVRSQSEVMCSSIEAKPGGFSPKTNYKVTIDPDRLYFSLRTARPKAPISLDKAAFGIPGDASLYLFAENHISVNFMSKQDSDAFQKCIEEMLGMDPVCQKFAIFLKIFYEGGFAYNQKVEMEKGYLPKNIGIASLGVVPAFEGQSGIGTGYPYLMESRFLPFFDTVPVTIEAISGMSARHSRYGLCFTRSVMVWETEAFQRDKVLNFCAVAPHGGFFYVPKTLRQHWQLGGLVYAFGEAKDVLEVPVAMDSHDGSGGTVAPAMSRTPSGPARDKRVCVICMDEEAVCAALPCGHRAFCETCKNTAMRNQRSCPVCRAPIVSMQRIY